MDVLKETIWSGKKEKFCVGRCQHYILTMLIYLFDFPHSLCHDFRFAMLRFPIHHQNVCVLSNWIRYDDPPAQLLEFG